MKKRILFFIVSGVPTAAETAAAKALGTSMFRNASQVNGSDSIERCDGVAGAVPAIYAAKFPVVDALAAIEPATEPALAPVPPVATGNPPDFLTPAAAPASANAEDPAAVQRAAENEAASNATVAQLKDALGQVGIAIPANAKKADLLALFLARP